GVGQAAVESLTELLRLKGGMLATTPPDYLNRRTITSVTQPRVRKIEAQHGEQHVEQSTEDLGWFAATPNRGKRQNTDQIVDAALKTLDLGCTFHFPLPGQAADGGAVLRAVCRLRSSRKNSC